MHPPHLPPPACTVRTHYTLQSLWKIVGLACISFLAGISGALAVAAWVAPNGVPSPWLYAVQQNSGKESAGVPQTLPSQTKQRLVAVYDTRRMAVPSVITDASIAGRSILLSSDGWSVMLFPAYKKGDERYWRGRDSQGTLVAIEKAVFDSVSGFLYLKWKGDGYRIVPLADADGSDGNDTVWVLDGETWYVSRIEERPIREDGSGVLAWKPVYGSQLSDVSRAGSFVFTSDGNLLGMAREDSALVPSWIIRHHLSALLGRGRVEYAGVLWQGFFTVAQENGLRVEDVRGFYVEKNTSSKKTERDKIKAGDIVTAIDGKSVTPETLAKDILLGQETLFVTVLRGNETLSMSVVKEIVSP